MSTLGFVMLVHEPLDRARQVARVWAAAGCPIVIHVDKAVPKPVHDAFVAGFADLTHVRFSTRHRCEWGAWSLVAATQTASEVMLREFPEVRHVYLASGSCLPLRPTEALRDYLDANPKTDFIESVTTRDVPWIIGGLDAERFTFSFPFSWKRHRFLFDRWVSMQRLVRRQRPIPDGVTPHLGSQWWCLTRQTLSAILEDPRRRIYERFFRHVWIPDESYFQTLVRLCSAKIESRSLTLSKFDFLGKPHIFYDDHLQLLRRSDCFVARKIWPDAERLYSAFLEDPISLAEAAEPNPGKIDRIFARAVEQRTRGRGGLYMQSRFPNWDWENGRTAAPYTVLSGFGDLFEDFPEWLSRVADCMTHGHLYAPGRAEFAGGQDIFAGALSDSAGLRDYNPVAFLTNLIWNTRGERQCFLFGPNDNQEIAWFLAADPNAHVSVISGAWAVPLYHANRNFSDLREAAAAFQKIESRYLDRLRGPQTKARVRIWSMAEFMEQPLERLGMLVEEIGIRNGRRLAEAPRLRPLDGFGQFLQNLKNQGMHPHLTGDFPAGFDPVDGTPATRKPYVVR